MMFYKVITTYNGEIVSEESYYTHVKAMQAMRMKRAQIHAENNMIEASKYKVRVEEAKQPPATPRTLEQIVAECILSTNDCWDGNERQYTYISPDGWDLYYVNKRKDGTLYIKGGYHRFARSTAGIKK